MICSSANVAFLAVPVRYDTYSLDALPLQCKWQLKPLLARAEHFRSSPDRLALLYPLFHALNGHRSTPRLETPPSR